MTVNTPKGPARWQRALDNFNNRPYSPGAKLFAERVQLAYEVVNRPDADPNTWGAFVRRTRSVVGWTNIDDEVQYYVCSTFCMMMQAQLDLRWFLFDGNELNRDRLEEFLSEEISDSERRVYDVFAYLKAPKRQARCQACGQTIYPTESGDVYRAGDATVAWPSLEEVKRTTAFVAEMQEDEEEEEVDASLENSDADLVTLVVDGSGTVIAANELRVLTITAREYELFMDTADSTRTDFARKYGASLEEYYG